MHVCVVTARARVLWPRPDIYCNYYVSAKFKLGGAPGCYDARGNTAQILVHVFKSLCMCIAGCVTLVCAANTSQGRLLEILRFIKVELEKAARSTPDEFDATQS